MRNIWHPEDEMARHRHLTTGSGIDFLPERHRPVRRPVSNCLSWDALLRRGPENRPLVQFKTFPRPQVTEELVEAFLDRHFDKNDVVYPSDVSATLDLDYDLVLKIFGKFVRESKLAE